MPKSSEELAQSRKEEIVNACACLYKTMSFQDITIQEIGKQTSFSRTSIYNYFQTKEEIFLALLQREYENWSRDLDAIAWENPSPQEFPALLAHTLEQRGTMLKLLCMSLYDMEQGSRLENLVALKRAYGRSMEALSACLKKVFPHTTQQKRDSFLFAFYPFLFGVYPYTAVTEKQRAAMEAAQISPPSYSIYELCRSFIAQQAQALEIP